MMSSDVGGHKQTLSFKKKPIWNNDGTWRTQWNIQMMVCIMFGFLTRTLGLNMQPSNSMEVFICNIKGAQS